MSTVATQRAELAAQVAEPVSTEGMTRAERRAEMASWSRPAGCDGATFSLKLDISRGF